MTEIKQSILASLNGHPGVYPNSEHIKPPMEKERIRVVEQATRTEVKLRQQKEIEERMEEIQMLRDQAKARYGIDIVVAHTEGEFIDIEV
jgi:hypothetical protein